jgi:hypothetical protein
VQVACQQLLARSLLALSWSAPEILTRLSVAEDRTASSRYERHFDERLRRFSPSAASVVAPKFLIILVVVAIALRRASNVRGVSLSDTPFSAGMPALAAELF